MTVTDSVPGRMLLMGTRGSTLARTQTQQVADQLSDWLPEVEITSQIIRTEGDVTTGSLASLGGTGVFAAALRTAVVQGRVDLAVHSLKDLPAIQPESLRIAAVPVRADPRDALCARDGMSLDELPAGARIGTGSPRRVAQLLHYRPDLQPVDIRGNVATRLARVVGHEHHHDNAPAAAGSDRGDLDAVILACAGLDRVDMDWAITERLDPSVMLPAPGQAALAVEVSTTRLLGSAVEDALAQLNDPATLLQVTAERAVLARLEAGCAAPIGALATVDAHSGTLALQAMVAGMDGVNLIRANRSVPVCVDGDQLIDDDHSRADAWQLGTAVAEELLDSGAELLPEAPPRGNGGSSLS
ncbi:hydroxymethylbilane synthase [Auritidibacter sp. NML100628]|uniref:hydroxymethylbilane synthase n=1 Tax=Auritidibacter sp. NML100628 TaxID=2170742 RepID=UPI001F02E0DF|nr:hydroxymethylbilane synthase [Auritidibacter sp. NML100628]